MADSAAALIPDAIVFAIHGYHFGKICEKHVV